MRRSGGCSTPTVGVLRSRNRVRDRGQRGRHFTPTRSIRADIPAWPPPSSTMVSCSCTAPPPRRVPFRWSVTNRTRARRGRPVRVPPEHTAQLLFTPETGHWLARLARPKSITNDSCSAAKRHAIPSPRRREPAASLATSGVIRLRQRRSCASLAILPKSPHGRVCGLDMAAETVAYRTAGSSVDFVRASRERCQAAADSGRAPRPKPRTLVDCWSPARASLPPAAGWRRHGPAKTLRDRSTAAIPSTTRRSR